MDFRGRVYPCPPHLNHLSSDMSRSLLCFAKGEPLGDKGLDWIKVSTKLCINLLTTDILGKSVTSLFYLQKSVIDKTIRPRHSEHFTISLHRSSHCSDSRN